MVLFYHVPRKSHLCFQFFQMRDEPFHFVPNFVTLLSYCFNLPYQSAALFRGSRPFLQIETKFVDCFFTLFVFSRQVLIFGFERFHSREHLLDFVFETISLMNIHRFSPLARLRESILAQGMKVDFLTDLWATAFSNGRICDKTRVIRRYAA